VEGKFLCGSLLLLGLTVLQIYVCGVKQAIDPAAGLFATMEGIKWLSVYKILGKSEVLYMARMVLCKTQRKMLGCLAIRVDATFDVSKRQLRGSVRFVT
jgi:hypothetical protein